MEHILISPGKLKLIMTRSDMEHYELDTAVMGAQENVCRDSLKQLFSDLHGVAGFDTMDDRLFVQLYPSKDGGAELYITKLGEKNEKPSVSEIKLTRIAAFMRMSALLDACRRLGEFGRYENSSAWQGEGRYFLLWEEKLEYRDYLNGRANERFLHFIGEGGEQIRDSAAKFYLYEYCRCFCPWDAVQKLGAFA